jgi:hypothetical protein
LIVFHLLFAERVLQIRGGGEDVGFCALHRRRPERRARLVEHAVEMTEGSHAVARISERRGVSDSPSFAKVKLGPVHGTKPSNRKLGTCTVR